MVRRKQLKEVNNYAIKPVSYEYGMGQTVVMHSKNLGQRCFCPNILTSGSSKEGNYVDLQA